MRNRKIISLLLSGIILSFANGSVPVRGDSLFMDNAVFAEQRRDPLLFWEDLKEGASNLIDAILEATPLGQKVKKTDTVGAQRRGDEARDEYERILSPCSRSTVLPNMAVRFSWEKLDQYDFVIYDDEGEPVYSKKIDYENHVIPKKFIRPLQENKSYTWVLTNTRTNAKYSAAFTVLDKRYEEAVKACLREIETMSGTRVETLIRQAAVLQQWSDNHPKDVDFYWLSYQILTSPELDDFSLNEESKKQKELLLWGYENHLQKATAGGQEKR